jgi:hypothetical protein
VSESLSTFLQATANVSGVATSIAIGPSQYGEEWKIERMSTSLTTGTGICKVYRDYVSPQKQIDYTDSGEGDTSENNSITLRPPEKILVQWTECTSGAIGVLTVSGTITRKGRW